MIKLATSPWATSDRKGNSACSVRATSFEMTSFWSRFAPSRWNPDRESGQFHAVRSLLPASTFGLPAYTKSGQAGGPSAWPIVNQIPQFRSLKKRNGQYSQTKGFSKLKSMEWIRFFFFFPRPFLTRGQQGDRSQKPFTLVTCLMGSQMVLATAPDHCSLGPPK